MSILIKNVLMNGKITDIAIRGERIAETAPSIQGDFDQVINGKGKAALPPFYNTHCHAAMTLLRGIADDMELFTWLTRHIWPAEAKLTPEYIYWGVRLACMEMIRSGTVFFNDMYYEIPETIQAVKDSGIRAAIGLIMLESSPNSKKYFYSNKSIWKHRDSLPSTIQLTWAPHAIYTTKEETLRHIGKYIHGKNIRIHTHLAETEKEVADCMRDHGCTPTEYLDKLGLLSPNLLAAHSIHLTDHDIELLRDRGVHTAFMPCSNYKLCSGMFKFRKLMDSGVHITLGTDGCASNNSLSMFDEMKAGSLGAKLEARSPLGCSASEIFAVATRNGAQAFGIDAGVIETGKLADLMLIELNTPMMVADHNLISNIVYSADSSCVDTVICNGKVLMQNRVIPGMDQVLNEARKCAEFLVKK